jgi:hypothetical protein
MRKILVGVACLISFLAGATTATVGAGVPNCPAEDSCSVDYRDGAWHIEKDTP